MQLKAIVPVLVLALHAGNVFAQGAGGVATGGSATGGSASGGVAIPGTATPGTATGGGVATGGSASGGVATGGTGEPGTATSGGVTCTCQDDAASNGQCFCDAKSRKIFQCVFQIAPSWPLDRPAGNTANCPSPAVDPEGFKRCLDQAIPKALPNASEIAEGCVKSTGAKPSPPSGLSSRAYRRVV